MRHDGAFYQSAIQKLFQIVNLDMEAVPFLLNNPQKTILSGLSNMDIILKARQEGISSLILALFTVDFLTVENMRCVVISHEDKATQRLFDRVRYYLESMKRTFPGDLPYTLKYNTKKELVNTQMNSTFYVGTAGAKAFGRGDTINNLHISELPQWPDQERTMIGLIQAVPKDGRIVIEATANGIGDYFYQMWVKARDGSSPFKTHFLPWFALPEYSMPASAVGDLTTEEQSLMNQYHLTREQIAWRRWKISSMNGDWADPSTHDKFNQEFPATAEEAFIVSGNPVFSPRMLKNYLISCRKPVLVGNMRGYMPITIEPNEKGYLSIWKEPDEFHTYAIGVDVSEGRLVSESAGGERERDASCGVVLDKTTYELVAIWYGRIDPDLLGRQMDMLGRYYNDALIGVERNAVGITPLSVLRDLNYPNLYYMERLGQITERVTADLGWRTDSHNKELLIAEAINLLRDQRIMIYDEKLIGEMMSFVRDSDGSARAAKSAYDDRVMAFLIGLRMLARAKTSTRGNQIEQDDSQLDSPKGFYLDGVSFNSKGMPTSPAEMDGMDTGELI